MKRSRYQKIVQSMRRMKWYEIGFIVILIVLPISGGFLSAAFIHRAAAYNDNEQLRKPSWAPPAWLFAPVWSILYLIIGVSWALLWKQGQGFNWATIPPFLIFSLQLLLNWLYTPLFFGLGNACIAFADIMLILGLTLSCLITFPRITKAGTVLLIPYTIWLTYAAFLNGFIVNLNNCTLNFTD